MSVYENTNIRCIMTQTKKDRRVYQNEYRKRKRRERGLLKQGRKPNTEAQREESRLRRKEQEKKWKKDYFKYSPQKRLVWAARRRAKAKGLEFNITESDIIIPEYCPMLGIKLTTHAPRGTKRDSIMSLDRIDNDKGYIKGNIWVISLLANTMKSNASPDMLLKFAESILKLYE